MKTILLFIAGLIALGILAVGSVVGYVVLDVYKGSTAHLEKSKIIDILSKETTLFYADGQTQVGSLFGNEHRQYVTLREMPKTLLDGVVAAEDNGFYGHWGMDFTGTVRAAYKNIILRKHEGASTITQQTVKNLYGRPVTNLGAKFVEAINAFKMERKYSKQEILEFYLNQFHVTGNGRGAGIAAKYYFDKEVSQLSLVESAFIAGSVKGPERYNPFTKRTPAAQDKARADAKIRKNYVLRRMFENTFISKEELEAAIPLEIPFRQGKFQFNELFVTELVQRQISRPEVLSALGVEDASTLGTMGLRITTTLEQPVQLAAQYGVRQNLSRLEMILNGFQKDNVKNFVNIQRPEKFGFYTAKIITLPQAKDKSDKIKVSLGVPTCTVPQEGIDRVAKITDQPYGKGIEKSKKQFLSSLKADDYVLVSVKEIDENQNLTCDIERRPRIQGALVAIDKGRVVAMVGGFASNEYNRAVFARRQPGSTFKSLTYYPALQLGWHDLSALLNIRNVYTWQGQFYYPRPDHHPYTTETTLVGAGSYSDNLASVFLLSKLLDKLTPDQFRDLLVTLDIYKNGEADEAFMRRVQGSFNFKMNEASLRAGAFSFVKNDFLTDVSVSKDEGLRLLIRSMNYGAGFDSEMERVVAGKGGIPAKERLQRIHILRNNYLRWTRVYDESLPVISALRKATDSGDWSTADATNAISRIRLSEAGNRLYYLSADTYQPSPLVGDKPIYPYLTNPKMRVYNPEEIKLALAANKDLASDGSFLLDGVLPLDLFREIQTQLASRYSQVEQAGPIERLFWHEDFRYSVGMVYAQKMVKNMGVESEVLAVPSYPLGANVVTLSELALAYQTILTGRTYRYFETPTQENQLMLIKRVEDANGQLLWEGEGKSHQLVDEFFSMPMMTILRGTVTHGTARLANQSIILRSKEPEADKELEKLNIKIPTFGKTGTTNDYVNATYVGFLPYPAEKGATQLTADNAYTIASYVGYDTNEPMRKRAIKVTGGFGALPAWIETAQALIREENFADKLDWQKLADKKAADVPFFYGSDASYVTAPIDSIFISPSSVSENVSEAKIDKNQFINEYAKSGNRVGRMALPGQLIDGVFQPKTKVAFFSARKKLLEKEAAQAAAKNAAAEQGAAEGNKDVQPSSPAPVGTLLPDVLDDVNMDDLDLPPPPPGLESESGKDAAPENTESAEPAKGQ